MFPSKGDVVPAPEEVEIRAALERVVASADFRSSPRLASFLRFVVEQTLTGQADRIKAYSVAVGALGRSDTFDPQTDPIVRVEAGRLRRALERYYAGSGRYDELVIDLPRGSYVPTFRRRAIGFIGRTFALFNRRLVLQIALPRFRFVVFLICIAAVVGAAVNFVVGSKEQMIDTNATPVTGLAGPDWTVTGILVAVTAVSAIAAWWISRN